jgi:hypothetical protein
MPSVEGDDNDVPAKGYGVSGRSDRSAGVLGGSHDGFGVVGVSGNWAGLYGESSYDYAAVLNGKVKITGNLEKAGGSFKIDHPLDPANKYLSHSFVESPDMKNVYDGVVVLDNKGKAEIELPDWFVYSIRILAISLPLSELLGLISISQRKYLKLQLLQTTVVKAAATKTTTTVTSRLQVVLQV